MAIWESRTPRQTPRSSEASRAAAAHHGDAGVQALPEVAHVAQREKTHQSAARATEASNGLVLLVSSFVLGGRGLGVCVFVVCAWGKGGGWVGVVGFFLPFLLGSPCLVGKVG